VLLYERDYGLSYSDLSSLKIPELRAHPVTFFELEKSLGLFGNLIQVVLGHNHPITTQFRIFWTAFTRQYRNQLHYEIDTRRIIKPVHILRNIQLICFHWFQTKRSLVPPPDPQFVDILVRLSLSLYTNPNLPPSLYQLVTQKPTPKLPLLDTSQLKKDDDSATALTGLSTLTSGSALTSALTGGPSRNDTFVKNTSVNPAL
jgi:hypothetical protein